MKGIDRQPRLRDQYTLIKATRIAQQRCIRRNPALSKKNQDLRVASGG